MPHSLKVGSHVLADFGNGHVIGHVAKLKYTNSDGEEKFDIQAPDGSVHPMAYREPPFDSAGSGLTFKLIH